MLIQKDDSFLKKFERNLKRNNFFNKDDKVLVCVSGGVDSTVLLFLILSIKKKYNLDLGIAHVNYNLRGEDSLKDELLVEKYSDKFSIPLHVKRLKSSKFYKETGDSLQVTARNLRYDFFNELAEKYHYNKIAIAHNANDNAETILFNLFRGTGIEGFKGINSINENIIRPLLPFTRKEISDFAKKNKIKFRHDKSNFKDLYSRNFIRLRIIPSVEKKINPNVIGNINKFAEIFTGFSGFLNDIISQYYKKVVLLKKPNEIYLDIKKLNNYINYLKERIIGEILLSGLKVEPNYQKIRRILELISGETGKRINIGDGIEVWHDREFLVFKKNDQNSGKENKKIIVGFDQTVKINGMEISSIVIEPDKVKFVPEPDIEYIDIDKLHGEIIIRKWRKGDYFFPIGLNKKKKISDFLIDKKVPLYLKDNIYVLENNGKIVWICNYRLDDRFKCDKNSKKILKLEIKTG
jgi:tRNA(Ile)-lysidine synthase